MTKAKGGAIYSFPNKACFLQPFLHLNVLLFLVSLYLPLKNDSGRGIFMIIELKQNELEPYT